MFRDISAGKKVIFILLVLASIVALCFTTYAIVYAQTESTYKKNAFVIGILFITAGRFTILFYKKYIGRH
jgi:hypothetical protein